MRSIATRSLAEKQATAHLPCNHSHHMGGDHNRLCRSLFVTCHRMSQKCDWHNRLWYFHRLWSPKTWNHRNHILPNRFCCFFCVRLTQPRSLVTGYFNSNLVGVRNISLSPPVSSLHLANSCAVYLHTPLVLVHMPGGNGIGAHHTGGIELRHCDVSPGEVVWERIPEGPLRYCTLHATLVT